MPTIEELNENFALDTASFESGQGQLPCCRIRNAQAEADVYLHGAHVTHYRPHGSAPVLWLSSRSRFDSDSPIRGGIPICWPWFGPHPERDDFPAHGFARTTAWTVHGVDSTASGTELVLGMDSDAASGQYVPFEFQARYRITVGEILRVELQVTNTGTSIMPDIGAALHSYFQIGSIESIRIEGLENRRFFDKLTDREGSESEAIRIAEETDRVYLDTDSPVRLSDESSNRVIEVSGEGSRSIVVWNPWMAKAQRMDDFPDEGYREMVCIETANALEDVRTLEPGQMHRLAQQIRLIP